MNLVKIPDILIPNNKIDYSKWSCIACDQFSSQPKYWAALTEIVGDSPSVLNLILPEAYLNLNQDEKIENINSTMKQYVNDNIFDTVNSFVFVKRTLNDGKVRLGLMVEVDLEQYEYTDCNNAYIKATEKTVTERLPARINIRKNACLELPHVMMLLDDKDGKIIECLYKDIDKMELLYDFDLNMNGGHISGYKVIDNEKLLEKLNKLTDRNLIKNKYNFDGNIAFVVGDGNHSLATAKECWNLLKQNLSEEEKLTHKTRYALVELVNIYDKSLEFEPIHRLLVGADIDFIKSMSETLTQGDSKVKVIYKNKEYFISVSSNPSDAIKDIQDFIDNYKANKNIIEDYIHGDDALLELAEKHNAVGIFMPAISKDGLFDYCLRRGALPRKSFSIGNAEDKRYYFEAKKIK